MTGRDLIVYILENNLEDKPVFDGDAFVGFVSEMKFAEMLDVGLATVYAWIALGHVEDAVRIGDRFYIPVNYVAQIKDSQKETKGSDCACITN